MAFLEDLEDNVSIVQPTTPVPILVLDSDEEFGTHHLPSRMPTHPFPPSSETPMEKTVEEPSLTASRVPTDIPQGDLLQPPSSASRKRLLMQNLEEPTPKRVSSSSQPTGPDSLSSRVRKRFAAIEKTQSDILMILDQQEKIEEEIRKLFDELSTKMENLQDLQKDLEVLVGPTASDDTDSN
jgi:hypothetical protein